MKMWETIIDQKYDCLERLKIPGGWLYRNITVVEWQSQTDRRVAMMTFVPNVGAEINRG